MTNIYNPISTYRVQFNKDFNFSNFETIIPYLHKLGVKTIYASPIFEAVPGSMHGYDGVNPNRINPEIGTEEQLEKICSRLHGLGMHWIQDIVPNHLAYHENNKWLNDVLEKKQDSPYANFFDIDWKHPWLEKQNRLNYRRFFTIDSLICVNIQIDEVFRAYHHLVKKLCDKKIFNGLRIDHIDGMYDPQKYLVDLRKLVGDDVYIVVEKILEPGENLPSAWPVQGNSGYDFLGMVNKLFTNSDSEYALDIFYFDITKNAKPIDEQIAEKKAYILHNHMESDLDNLVRLYKDCCEGDKRPDDEIRRAIANYLISCPVYRYYGNEYPVMEQDKRKDRQKLKPFYTRCMQFTGPLMAKGVEDTFMYTFNRFIGHNEVGDSPVFFRYLPDQFHSLMIYRQKQWPLSLNGTSTHDTKRGEDARARLNAMSDHHEEWIALVKEWMTINAPLKINGVPDGNDEYFIYQTLLGSFPLFEDKTYADRIAAYLQKALREAKVHSHWESPDAEYEQASIQFAHKLLDKSTPFWKSFYPFLQKLEDTVVKKSFSQLVLKFTCPGVPDIYQGTELWDLSLVDPDNRRPVDYALRMKLLDNKSNFSDQGSEKLQFIHRLLLLRTEYADILSFGDYAPLVVEGKYRDHVLAFARTFENKSLVVVIRVRSTSVPISDAQIILPDNLHITGENLLTGETDQVSNQKFLPNSTPAVYRSF